jgi:uncharacterized cupredoxin-like copper-binding protein
MKQTTSLWRLLMMVGIAIVACFACVGMVTVAGVAAVVIRDRAAYANWNESKLSAPAPAPAATRPAGEPGTTVNVTTRELAFTLDTTQANAGTITFVVTNNGHAPHDFALKGNGVNEKTPLIQPGGSESLTVELKPGTYEFECTVPGHAGAGMRGTFTVT